jgi:hypothetical protein
LPVSDFCLPSLLFACLALPLVGQDLEDGSVSLVLLASVYLAWLFSALIPSLGGGSLQASAVVLLIGTALLKALPGRLGEADVVFMSGMAALFQFWPLMMALALGCVAGLSAFVWLFRDGIEGIGSRRLPLLPSLYWGGLAVILGGIRL